MPRLPILLAIALAPSALAADELSFTVNQGASSVQTSLSILADSEGTLIGAYDAVNNPSGTQTRPGFFGGSGNNPIPLDLDALSSTDVDTNPTGAFAVNIDSDALTFDISALTLNLIASGAADSGVDLTLEWSAFNTVNPTFIFPGGIPLTVPLSSTQLTTLSLDQTGPSALPGVLTPDTASSYTLAAALPVRVTVAADSATLPSPETAFDAVLPLTGQLTLNTDNSATISLAFDLEGLSQTIDLSAAPAVEDLPFELPTLGEDTASVLLTLQFASATVAASGAINIVADGAAANCNAADLAEPPGALDFSDVITFLTLFAEGDPAADLALPTDAFDFSDVVAFLTAFAAGCP